MATAHAANPAETLFPVPEAVLPAGAGPTSEAIAALDAAIAAAGANFGPLSKDGENTYTKSSYLPLDTLLDAVRGALLAQGILITSCFQLVRGGFVVVTTLAHQSGGWRSSMFPVGDPQNPQKVAASATYGLRVNLCQLLAVVGRDDDGQAVSMPQAPAPQQWTQPQPQQATWPAPGQPSPPAPSQQFQPPQGQPPQGDSYSNQLPASGWSLPAAPQSAPQPFV